MSRKFDINHPLGHVTRGGRKAKIIYRLDISYLPLVVVVDDNGEEIVVTYTSEGHFYEDHRESDLDLVNVEENVALQVQENGVLVACSNDLSYHQNRKDVFLTTVEMPVSVIKRVMGEV